MIPVEYEEMEEKYLFRHWVNYEVEQRKDNFNLIQDINEWCGQMFGELGVKWGYFRTANNNAPGGSIRTMLHQPILVTYSWRFKNREDASLFKLTWGGA